MLEFTTKKQSYLYEHSARKALCDIHKCTVHVDASENLNNLKVAENAKEIVSNVHM